MIVYESKHFETNSLYPNSNWYNTTANHFLVDETTTNGKILAQKIIDNAPYFDFVLDEQGNLIDITPTGLPLEEVKKARHDLIKGAYKKQLTSEVVSSIMGADGTRVVFGYEEIDQLNYSKRANVFALDPTLTTCQLGTNSHGVVTLSKEQFLQFMRDCDNHEMSLYMKFADLRSRIDNATTVEEVNSVVW